MSELKQASIKSPTRVEKVLIAIWKQALDVKTIGENDNFFDLGGTASLALQLVERIRTYLGIEIPSNSLIENPTVRGLARCLQSANQDAGKDQGSTQVKKSEYPASFGQSWLWLQYKLEPDSPAYNLFGAYRLHGILDRKALEQALLVLIERHESLRTVFSSTQEGELLQRIIKPHLAIAYENLEHYSGPEQEYRLRRLVEAAVQRPFVLEAGPLFRCLLIALSPELHVLALNTHHSVTDAWSQEVMVADLAHLYHAISKGMASALPQLKMQYGEFSEWQREHLNGSEWERQSAYWKAQLAGAPPFLSLPTDHPRTGDAHSCPAGVHNFCLGEGLSNRLRSISLSNRTTLFMTLVAVFQVLMSRYCRQHDLCIASPIANRPLKETEELIGFFVNTLVLRANVEDNPPFSEFLRSTREMVLEALDHLAMPFDKIVSLLRPQRSLGPAPYAQVMFAFQNIPSRLPEHGDLTFESVVLATGIPKFEISLVLDEKNSEKQITGHFSFDTALFEQITIERMGRCYLTLLNAAVNDARCPVFQLSILADQERKLVLEEWNRPLTLAAQAPRVPDFNGARETNVAAVAASPVDQPGRFPEVPSSVSQAYILDRFLQPVPPGAAGELYCAEGNVLGNGSDRGQQSRESVENSFGPGRLYRTYQLVHNVSNGQVEVIGTVGDRASMQDRKVNPDQIQSTLEQHPDVDQSAVTVDHNTAVSYIVLKKEACSHLDRLRAELRNMLARFTSSSNLIFVPALLFASDGRPDFAKMAEYKHWVDASTPLTPVQKVLGDIWRNVLGVNNFGIHDNFFELGGNSLLAVRVATEARQHQLYFASRDLFRHQTIADLAGNVKSPQPRLDHTPARERDWWPTSPIQRWFFSRSFFNPTLWNMSTLFKANRTIDVQLLRAAVKHLFRRHIALRLQFRKHDGEWVQYVVDRNDDAFHFFDLSHLDPATQLVEIVRLGNELQSSFRFSEGTLVRFGFFDLGSQGARLLIAAHHLVCDGFSMTVVMEDLTSIYASLSSSARVESCEAGNSFLEWTELVHNPWMLKQVAAEHSYWAPKKEIGLPYDFPEGQNLVANVNRLHTELTPSETAELLALARQKYHSSIEVLLLWGVASCIMDWKKERFAVLTMLGHGRENQWAHLDLSRTVGYFTVHYPLVLEIPDGTSNDDAVEAVRTQLDSVPNHGIGYGILRFIYNQTYLDRSVALQEEGEISFNYLGNYDLNLSPHGLFAIANEKAGAGRESRAENPYKFGYFGYILNGKLHADWWFNTELHRVETIKAVAGSFDAKLRSLLAA